MILSDLKAAFTGQYSIIKITESNSFETNETRLSFWRRMGFIEEKTSVRETDGRLLNLIHMCMALKE